ncbi:MAG: glycerol kinase, partial [Acholeplasmataceae bacterium]|nr:glycerol kinase [Acholeplasmataceae bacterium]
MNTKEVPIYSQAGLLTTIAWGINGKIEYALEGSVFVAGAAVQWLRDGLKFFPKSSDCEEYLQKNPDSGGVYMVPAFVGLGTPYWDNDARGAIFGLTRATTKENVIAAVIEGIAYQAKDVMDVMKKEAGFDIQYLGVDGGASVNNFLMQFQADLLNVKLVRPRCLETTALGAFYLAALAIGWFKSTEEIKKYHQVDRLFLSHMTEEERERRLKGWQKAVQATLTFK